MKGFWKPWVLPNKELHRSLQVATLEPFLWNPTLHQPLNANLKGAQYFTKPSERFVQTRCATQGSREAPPTVTGAGEHPGATAPGRCGRAPHGATEILEGMPYTV